MDWAGHDRVKLCDAALRSFSLWYTMLGARRHFQTPEYCDERTQDTAASTCAMQDCAVVGGVVQLLVLLGSFSQWLQVPDRHPELYEIS
eukprot:3947204-Alexandrium_andersonii.AAC.1